MKTWKQSGLLDVVTEKILILNDPSPEEYSIALEYGFRVIEPNSIPNSKVRSLLINFSLSIEIVIILPLFLCIIDV